MAELAISNQRLNILQRLQIKLFMHKKTIYLNDFNKALDFIKNSPEVISRIIDDYMSDQGMFIKLDETEKNKLLDNIIKQINNDYNFVYALLSKDNNIFDNLPDDVIIKFLVAYPQGRNIIAKDQDDILLKVKLNNYAKEVIERVLKDDNKDINNYYNFVLDLFDYKFSDFISKYYNLVKDNQEINDRMIRKIVTEGKVELISYLDLEKKEKLFTENPSVLQYANYEVQLDFIRKNKNYAKYALFSVQDSFVKENPEENFAFTHFDYQFKKIFKDSEYYNYSSSEFKEKIFKENLGLGKKNNTKNEEILQQAQREDMQCKILERILTLNPEKIEELENWEYINKIIKNIPQNTENLTIEQIKKIFLHTKYKSAPGSLGYGMMGNPGGGIEPAEIQNRAYHNDIVKISNEALVELLKTDSNYVLLIDAVDDNENSEINNERYEQIFKLLYKDNPNIINNFDTYKKIIHELIDNRSTAFGMVGDGLSKEKIQRNGRIEELKILFNPSIMNSNTFEDITKYYNVILNNYRIMDYAYKMNDSYALKELKDSKEVFYKIIKNTYGESAIEILESRPNLNVHTINSLEVFDRRIMQNFSKEAINDFITYRFQGFSVFLDIAKDPLRLRKFKQYYELLSSVIGQDAKTMQKAIFEFDKVEKIMDNKTIFSIISKTNDNNKEKMEKGLNLENIFLFALVSGNKYGAENIEDLENYESLLNEKLKSGKLSKEETCQNLFGVKVHELNLMSALYGISGGLITKEEKNMNEKMFNYIIKFIESKDPSDFIQTNGIYRNPISFFSALRKIKENQAQIMNSNFLTKEKMDKAIEDDMIKNPNIPITERPIYKIIDDNGNEIYHLNGYDFSCLSCQINLSIELSDADFLYSEHPGGNSAICTRYVNTALAPKNNTLQFGADKHHYFTHLDANQIIASNTGDARTTHSPKQVEMSGIIGASITELDKIAKGINNEISFYRVTREHTDRTRDSEGRIIPQFTSYPPSEEFKKLGVCQLVIHYEKYRSREEKENEKSTEEELRSINA